MLYEYSDRIKELIEIAFIDESFPYEVDMTGIYYDTKLNKFCVISALGCSCWEGDYIETQHNNLKQCFEELEKGEEHYNINLEDIKELRKQAKNFCEMQ